MSADDINSYKTVIKAKLSGEDYHDIVIDWTDTSQPYEQQVFSRVSLIVNCITALFLRLKKYQEYLMSIVRGFHESEISGISVERTAEFMFMDGGDRYEFFHNERAEPKLENTLLLSMQLEFNRENLLNLMNGNERFGLSLRLSCDDNKHFYMWYAFVPERFMDETECTLNFCHYLDNRAILNKLKAIVTNDALQSQMKDFLVQPRFPYFDDFFLIERWHHAYRRFNVMQYYYRTCYPFYQNVMFVCQNFDYVPAQLYLRTRG